MINLPVPPRSLVTRQVTCICCHEQFAISVDEPDRRQSGAADSWHVPADQFHSTQLRFENNRSRRPASPVARAVPEPNPEHSPHRDPHHYYFVTCPRCGADNRNWLNFLRQMPFHRQISLLIGYVLVGLAVLGILVLIVNPDLLPQVDLSQKKHSLPLIICLILAGLLPLLLIPDLWYESRIRDHMSRTVPALTSSLSPAALRAILILVVFATLLPTLFYVVPPFVREIKSAIFNPPPDTTLVTRIDEVSKQVNLLAEPAIQQPVNNAFLGLVSILNTQLRTCQKSQIDQMINTLQAISASDPHGNPLLVQSATRQLTVIRETANDVCRVELIVGVMQTLKPALTTTLNQALPNEPTVQQCQAQWTAANEGQEGVVEPACYNFVLAVMLADLEEMQYALPPYSAATPRIHILGETRLLAADPNLMPGVRSQIASNITTLENSLTIVMPPEPPLIEWRFLAFWFTAVILTWLVCTICAFSALNERTDWLDPHVPRPIFTSVANMTRVAVWEAKQALEITGYEERIQWMRAIRNEAGGIDLVGFFRDPPDLLADGTINPVVRTQRYGISTDMWCRIREARITDMMTPRPAGAPTFVLPEFAPAEVRVGRHRL